MKPRSVANFPMDPTTSLVTAGFYLFGPHWPEVYENIEVPDKRGRMRKLPSNMGEGYEKLLEEFGEQ